MMETRSQINRPLPETFTAVPTGMLQRKCAACGTHTIAGGECRDCENKKGRLQRKPSNNSEHLEAPPIVNEVLNSPGQPLDTATRSFMEPRFGHDFSHVRIHTDTKAAQSAASVNSLAYTVGRDVVFGSGQYMPETAAGRSLLAHELTHTVQQGGAASGSTPVAVGASNNASEKEADRAAQAVSSGQRHPVEGHASPSVQRQPISDADKIKTALLTQELQPLIDEADWKNKIRKRVYPKESAAGIQRSKERHEGKRKDMTGLGQITALNRFAGKIKDLQSKWTKIATPVERVKKVGDIAGEELEAANVPKFRVVDKEPMDFKGFFQKSLWRFVVSEDLVNGASLNDVDGAELANVMLHESRHAEQDFLAARFDAGVNKKDAAAIENDHEIHKDIAVLAVARKFDAKTNAEVAALGKQMFEATVTEGDKNQKISDDDGMKEMKQMRQDAVTALSALKAHPDAKTIADATARRDALRAQIAIVEKRYTDYRNIPYEADAHEVGDAAELAFKGWK
jgi:hypothetical protein